MPARRSAVDCISPAFNRAKQMLFQPFRLGLWARLGVVAVITGEFSSGGGYSYSGGSLPTRQGSDEWLGRMSLVGMADWEKSPYFGPLIATCVLLALAILVLWVYSDCVYRFILFDAVLTGRCKLREGWRRWRRHGRRFFLWVVGYTLTALAVLAGVVGVPLLLAWRAGWFLHPGDHIGALFGWGFLYVLLVLLVFVALAAIELLARDFLVPLLALEDLGLGEAWGRLGAMLRAEKGSFALYVVMKAVLAVGSAILFSIVNLAAFVVLLIPLGTLGVALFFAAKAAGLAWTASAILLVIALGLVALAAVLYVVGVLYAPGLVFFQAYTLQFFGRRYAALGEKLFPDPEPPPALEAPPAPSA